MQERGKCIHPSLSSFPSLVTVTLVVEDGKAHLYVCSLPCRLNFGGWTKHSPSVTLLHYGTLCLNWTQNGTWRQRWAAHSGLTGPGPLIVCYIWSGMGWYGESIFGNCWSHCYVLKPVLGRLNMICMCFRRSKLNSWILTRKSAQHFPPWYLKTKRWIIFWQDSWQVLFQIWCSLNLYINNTSRAHLFLLRMMLTWTFTETCIHVRFCIFPTHHVSRVFCTLYLSVNGSQKGGVICVSCCGRCCSLLSSGRSLPPASWAFPSCSRCGALPVKWSEQPF